MNDYFAVVGDVHGHMNKMVALLQAWEKQQRKKLKFVLQVGDFEPHRHEADMLTMAASSQHRQLGDFPYYYQKAKHFPWPIYFIAGNHEPHGFLDEHPQGFYAADNCYYLGRAGKKDVEGLTIAGLSGIYDQAHFQHERPPLSVIHQTSRKKYTYFNESDVDTLLKLATVDILLFHEWPSGIIAEQDDVAFLQQRRSLRSDLVGNDYARLLIDALSPRLVLCGHMHRRYRQTLNIQGRQVAVECLASLHENEDGFAVFAINENHDLVLVDS